MIVQPEDTVCMSADNRCYIINGSKYYRVSEMLAQHENQYLARWIKAVGEEEAGKRRKETADYGKTVHEITWLYDMGNYGRALEKAQQDVRYHTALQSWRMWARKYVIEWLACEITVYSPYLQLAGTIDRIGKFRGRDNYAIFDLKTSHNLYSDVPAQLAAYRELWNDGQLRRLCIPEGPNLAAIHLPRSNPKNLKVLWYNVKSARELFCQRYADFRNVSQE